ncbi:MAG: hypothetical protein AAF153_00940, partial [Pseudomonadota bacterium]
MTTLSSNSLTDEKIINHQQFLDSLSIGYSPSPNSYVLYINEATGKEVQIPVLPLTIMCNICSGSQVDYKLSGLNTGNVDDIDIEFVYNGLYYSARILTDLL